MLFSSERNPEIKVDRDTTLTYDARTAVHQQVIGDRPVQAQGFLLQYGRWWTGALHRASASRWWPSDR